MASFDELPEKPLNGSSGDTNGIVYHNPVKEPDNVMRKVVAESCSLVPGTAAVLLQIASKPVGLGMAAHSGFTINPIRRARRSFAYIYVMAFGTPEERRLVSNATHKAHSHVKGYGYDADNVDAQLWVAATMYWSLALGYELMYGKMCDCMADQMYKESSVFATGLHVPPEKWPKDRKAFEEYWEEAVSQLELTEEAKGVAHDVLYPVGHMLIYFKPFFAVTGWMTRAVTIELMPEKTRHAFGLSSTKLTRTSKSLFLVANRMVYPFTLRPVRHSFKNYYMVDFRHRVKHRIPL